MNREYKSDVFSLLMQKPEYALDVYNALNGTNYENEELIEILQLEKGISLTIRNDASFIIDSHLNLYEHQSTYNPNMPVRYLIYIAFLLEKMLKDFFTVHRQEVLKVAMLDYTFERQIELEKRDSYAEGRTEERSRGIRAMYNGLTKIGVSSDQALNSICEEYHITLEEAKKYLEIKEKFA